MRLTETLRWDQLHRFRLIEIVLLWEGRLTTNHLSRAFNIGRQQASRDINSYIKDHAPENLIYDRHLKGYIPTQAYNPIFTKGSSEEYLQLLHSAYSPESGMQLLTNGIGFTHTLSIPERFISPTVIRPLVLACNLKRQVEINYASLKSQQFKSRKISPHTLIHSGYRWHIRAYCHHRERFSDFVLSRIEEGCLLLDKSYEPASNDKAWQQKVEIKLSADPRLSAFEKTIIEKDYGMNNGNLIVSTRAALIQYYLQLLRVDSANDERSAKEQQIVVANLDELAPYLFNVKNGG